jgi:outer membrane protein insertion porin family
MRIREGDQATIDEVIISGNERTNDHVIRRELSTIPGQKFRRSDLIRTQQQLSQMGYFNPQKIDQDIRPNMADGTVDIEWKVEEQSNDQIELSGGWGGFYGFVGTVGLSFNNFSLRNVPHFDKWKPLPVGDGQRLSLRAQANGRSFQSYSLSFTEPWLGGRKPNSFTVSLNHSVSRLANNNFEFTDASSLKQSGITVGFGKRLEWPDNYFSLTSSLSFLVYNYNNYFGSSTLPAEGQTNEIMLTTTLSRNSIDNPMYPTTGSTISLALSLTPPYSLWRDPAFYQDINTQFRWTELHKWMLDAKFYLKLIGSQKPDGRSLVLETKAHFGFIGAYNQELGVGPFQRFLMGGDGLAGGFNSFVLGQDIVGLRGYPNNAVTPPLYALRGQQRLDEIEGGIVYNKFGLELRYPVVTGQSATVYGFLFTEAGNNWNNYQDFNPFSLYKAAGVGARIFMPAFGLIGLNWAYGFDKLPFSNDISGSQFHFTIGQQLR